MLQNKLFFFSILEFLRITAEVNPPNMQRLKGKEKKKLHV